MAYDASIEFPLATSKTTREGPVFGAFSQITKMTNDTLEYWGAAMQAVPESILVIKDRGALCDTSRKRVEDGLKQHGIDPSRVYFFGPVGSHLDHLDSYNAIDIALDTTPWSGATTAFEALGMGVPLIAICGDTTSSRMSTSVVSASGRTNWIAHSKDEFASIAVKMARNYQQIRRNKSTMQNKIRAGILFDEARIRHDFYETIEQLCRASTGHG
jgi:predicted O-linked N-acetylglucosamine transferase (SPINDLY family)